ncbi:HAMP domain-containing sensor histidine kinase, partial [Oleiphilus sp. HI0123]
QFGLFNTVANITAGLLITLLVYHISSELLRPFSWFILNSIVVAVGFYFYKKFRKENVSTRSLTSRNQKWLIWIAIANSLTWSFLVLTGDLSESREAVAMLVITSIVIVAASIAVGLNAKIYLAFISPFILLCFFKYLSSPYLWEFLSLVSGCLIIGYGQAINARAVLNKSIRLRNENRYLLKVAEEKRKEALQASESKSKFLAAASHDLRQPLQSIEFLAYTISHTDSVETQKRIFPKLNSSVKALRELLDSLLD